MSPQRRFLGATLVSTVIATSAAYALERHTRALMEGAPHSEWRAGASCSLVYYNTCTDWVYYWQGWTPGDRIGVQYDACCQNGQLGVTFAHIFYGAPAGYGFTGTLSVYAADGAQCPAGNALAAQAWLPTDGWNVHVWNVAVPESFAVVMQFGPAEATPVAVTTDHPAAVAPGPPACGTCYPTNRTNHSYWWGTPGSPLCPGFGFYDSVCDAQLLWDARTYCPVSAEASSWGEIKALYR